MVFSKKTKAETPFFIERKEMFSREEAGRIFVQGEMGQRGMRRVKSRISASARPARKIFEMGLSPHRVKPSRRALVQLPAHWNGARPRRGENWRPGAPGRNDCLSDRRERVSFRQRRAVNSQGGMTGRPFGPLLTFRLVGTRGKVSGAGIAFQKRKQPYVSDTYGQAVLARSILRKTSGSQSGPVFP